MLEAFFGGIFSFVTSIAVAVVSTVVKAISGELFSGSNKADRTPQESISYLKDIDQEISDREKSLVNSKSKKDEKTLEELKQQQKDEYSKYENIKSIEAKNDLETSPESYTQSLLIPGTEHKLQYHLGVAVITSRCRVCNRPMKLQHRTVDEPNFNDFFWQCTGFYVSDSQCRNTLPFKASDLSLLHNTGALELQLDKKDLLTIAGDPSVQKSSIKRLTEHLGDEDDSILCPIHLIPMYLKEKNGGHRLPLLDRYHLGCSHIGCKQIAKLKSYPQLAAFLKRKEGIGIIH